MTDPFAVDPNNARECLASELAGLPFDLVDRLVQLRRDRGLSRSAIAGRMNRDESHVSRFESEAGDPRLSTVARYAYAVGARITITIEATDVHGDRAPAE